MFGQEKEAKTEVGTREWVVAVKNLTRLFLEECGGLLKVVLKIKQSLHYSRNLETVALRVLKMGEVLLKRFVGSNNCLSNCAIGHLLICWQKIWLPSLS